MYQATTQTFPAYDSVLRRTVGTMIVTMKHRFAQNAANRKLRSLNDHYLKDIGISRSEIPHTELQSPPAFHW